MATFRADSMDLFDSWTDADLVRAVDLDPGSKDEYVAELAARAVARAELQAQTDKLQADVAAKIRELLHGRT